VIDLPGCCRLVLRGDRTAADKAGEAFDVPLPAKPLRAAHVGERAALWLGRDEWHLLAPTEQAKDLTTALASALGDTPHALVDVSDNSVAVELNGPDAVDILSAGCPLDFDLTALPVDMCTRTLYGKAEIVLWRKQSDRFRIDVRRSFLPYMKGLMSEILREQANVMAEA
jgi:sarcosine oxidase subunit gamma